MATCSSCQADVIFVPSATSGKSMILDAKPKKGVIMVAIEGNPAIPGPIVKLDPDRLDFGVVAHVVDVYTDHHATCPDAKSWIRRNRANPPKPFEGVMTT